MKQNLLLFGHWMVTREIIHENLDYTSKKLFYYAILDLVGISLLISFALLGMIDGPEMLTQFLQFNFTIHSMLLVDWGIYAFLLIFGIILGIGWLIPFILNIIVNNLKIEDENNKKETKELFIASVYQLLPVLFYALVLYTIAILAASNPQMVHLNFSDWQNPQFYALGVLILIAMGAYASYNNKVLNWTGIKAYSGPIITFFLIAITMTLFFII